MDAFWSMPRFASLTHCVERSNSFSFWGQSTVEKKKEERDRKRERERKKERERRERHRDKDKERERERVKGAHTHTQYRGSHLHAGTCPHVSTSSKFLVKCLSERRQVERRASNTIRMLEIEARFRAPHSASHARLDRVHHGCGLEGHSPVFLNTFGKTCECFLCCHSAHTRREVSQTLNFWFSSSHVNGRKSPAQLLDRVSL